MIDAYLMAARFLHYVCLMALFGALAFPLYAARGLAVTPPAWRRRIAVLAMAALAGALASGLVWFLMTTAGMSGEADAAVDPQALWGVLTQTSFGGLWIGRLVLALVTWAALSRPWGRLAKAAPLTLAGLLLASLALTGHAQGQEGPARLVHETADALHLLAAGAWLGGLAMLGFVLRQARVAEDDGPPLAQVLSGFSAMGYAAVGTLVLTGAINGLFQIGSPVELVDTGYGLLLSGKVLLFLAMVALAAANRFWISPAIAGGADEDSIWIVRLKRQVLAEQALGGLVLLIVAVLGTLEPGA